MNKDIHSIYETYTNASYAMDLPVYAMEFMYCRGERDFYLSVTRIEEVNDAFLTPEAAEAYQEFTEDRIPSINEFIRIMGSKGEVTIHSEEVVYVFSTSKEQLKNAHSCIEEPTDEEESERAQSEHAEIDSLPDISAQWQKYADIQNALKSNEHGGTDLTF